MPNVIFDIKNVTAFTDTSLRQLQKISHQQILIPAKSLFLTHSVVCTLKAPQTSSGWSSAAFTSMRTRIRWWSTSRMWALSIKMSFWAVLTGWSSLLSLTGAASDLQPYFPTVGHSCNFGTNLIDVFSDLVLCHPKISHYTKILILPTSSNQNNFCIFQKICWSISFPDATLL